MDDTATLLASAKSGCAQSRNRLTECLIPAAQMMAGHYVKRNYDMRHHADELHSVALEALVDAVDYCIGANSIDSVEATIKRIVRCRLHNARYRLSTSFAVSPRTVKRMRAKNQELPQELVITQQDYQIAAAGDTASEMLDVIAACCEADIEQQIVSRRLSDMTYQHIADELGISVGTVCATLSRVKECVNRALELADEARLDDEPTYSQIRKRAEASAAMTTLAMGA
ncbi:MAG: hypothetical protein L0Z53_19130 [Acidobacteriales bacterium]|nr:hypothetical protein [Terriglobales bacterium]